MGISINVDLSGVDRLRARMDAAPLELANAIFAATVKATDATAESIRGVTPVRTGRLASSIVSTVTKTPDGARGRISTNLRYARFVERGTREHGRAQLMFERGVKAEEPNIAEFYRSAIDSVVVTLR
jgi:hypothetical protein